MSTVSGWVQKLRTFNNTELTLKTDLVMIASRFSYKPSLLWCTASTTLWSCATRYGPKAQAYMPIVDISYVSYNSVHLIPTCSCLSHNVKSIQCSRLPPEPPTKFCLWHSKASLACGSEIFLTPDVKQFKKPMEYLPGQIYCNDSTLSTNFLYWFLISGKILERSNLQEEGLIWLMV